MIYQIETHNWLVQKVISLFYRLGALQFTVSAAETESPYTIAELESHLISSLREMRQMQAGKIPLRNAKSELQKIEEELVQEGYERGNHDK